MGKTQTSTAPLYKPALYVHFSKRHDLAIWLTFQSDITASERTLSFSTYLAGFFGIEFDSSQVFIGVPSKIWGRFHRLNYQSFSVHGLSIQLHYHLDVETKRSVRTAIGNESLVSLGVEELTIELPVKPSVAKKIRQSNILHLTEMTEDNQSVDNNRISLTKRFSSTSE